MDVAEKRFWVVDVEGSGNSPPEIVDIAILELSDMTLSEKNIQCLIKPSLPIQPMATRIHGITDDDVSNAPSIEDVADDILMLLDESAIVGHNVKVEVDIISRSIPDWSPKSAIDTMRLAKALRPGLSSYSLENLGNFFGKAEEAAIRTGKKHHSALYDATLTALIFRELVAPLPSSERERALRDADILNPKQGTLW